MSTSTPETPRTWRGVRWWICVLLFAITTINYLDRQSLSVLKPALEKSLHWSEADYGWINFAFQSAYALMYTFAGRLADLIGARSGFILGVVIWSLAAMAHAAARTPLGFAIARFFLGAGESMNFPASLKTVAEWFPQKERAMAAGIFNSGSNMGVVFSFAIVWLAQTFQWQIAFLITGALGFIWLYFWTRFYRPVPQHPSLSEEEREYIQSGQPADDRRQSLRWTVILRSRQAWPFLVGKFMTDPVWWFYLYWLPSYLHKERGLSVLASAGALAIPYLAADVGSIGGGWISDHLIARGWPVGKARYAAMALCAICMPGAIVAVRTDSFTVALALISLATAAHQGWSANIFTTATDMFPAGAAGSVIGLGGACGAIGGMLMTVLVGGTLQWLGSYSPIFIWAGLMHPLSLVIFLVVLRGQLPRVELRGDEDRHSSPPLLAGGAGAILAGAAGLWIVLAQWSALVAAAKSESAAAGAAAAAIGVILIGAALVYASFPARSSASA